MRNNCLNCEDRKLGCHSTCEVYARMKKRQQEINIKQRQFMDGWGHDTCLAPKSGKGKRYA